MYSQEQLLKMLSSSQSSLRYDACEDIRINQESSPEIIAALEKAILDLDPNVAERAKLALLAALHHHVEKEGESPFLEHQGDVQKATSRGNGFNAFSFIFFRPTYLGQRLFYPWGAFGHGYVVPTETEYVRLRHQFENIIIIFSIVIFVIAFFLIPGKGSSAILPFRWACFFEPFYILAYIVTVRFLVRNLDKSPEMLTGSMDGIVQGGFYSQNADGQQGKYNPVVLWIFEIICLSIVVIGLILFIITATRDIGAVVINLFGLIAITIAALIFAQRRESRRPKPQ
jgi:hypothetical protein